jgi:hypothetical protein
MNELVRESSLRRRTPVAGRGLKFAMVRLLGGLGIKRRTFADRVEEHRRGKPEEQRARQQALRCADGARAARLRLQQMAQHMTEGGIETSVQFRPIVYKVGVDGKGRKIGFAEMQGAIALSVRTPSGREITSLPIIIRAARKDINILPNIAELQAGGQQNYIVSLFLKIADRSGGADEHLFCERFADALAQAVASHRILT